MKKIILILMPALLAAALTAAVASYGATASDCSVTAMAVTPADDALTAIQNALEKLRAGKYTATATGKTVAKKGFVTYEQQIAVAVIGVGGEYYARSEAKSKFFSMKHEVYARDGSVAYRNNGGSIATVSAAEYANAYGVVPGESIDGHLVTADTVVSARLVGATDGLLTYDYEIDPERGCAAVRRQMKEFGGLKALPVYRENARLTLTVREDYAPVALDTTEKYTIKFGVIGNVNCTQTMSYGFSYGDVAVPDAALFAAALG